MTQNKSVKIVIGAALGVGLAAITGGGVAQAGVPVLCGESDSVFILAETADYWINLCGGDLPHVLVVSGKKDRKVVKADMDDGKSNSDVVVARKDGVVYRFVTSPASKASLSAARGGQSLFKQPATLAD